MTKNKKVIIVDYGVGNIYSVAKAFNKLGCRPEISEEAGEIESADALVLPGVGSFRSGIEGLRVRGLLEPIKNFAKLNKPILGICLGAQLLLEEGYEFGRSKGIGVIPGKVIKFPDNLHYSDGRVRISKGRRLEGRYSYAKIPHIGWNEIYPIKKKKWDKTILDSVKDRSDVYFVHSYLLKPNNKEAVLSLSSYGGYQFCSAIRKGNIYGCQFHPEKSGKTGLKIIKNFLKLI